MARPKKETIDYFPHSTNHKKTIFILEQRFGNDGYSFWFKLLEMLGGTAGHYIDFNDETAWEFLQAKTHLSGDFCTEIINLLAKLQAIDRELWEENKIIWCQNFVDGVSDVYKNRRLSVPERPSFYNQKPHKDDISTDNKPQSKVNKSKVNNIIIPEWLDKDLWDCFIEMRKKQRAVPTEKATGLLIKQLEKLRSEGNDPNKVLEQSIMNNWKGLFPLKGGQDGKNRQNPRQLPARESYTRPEDLSTRTG